MSDDEDRTYHLPTPNMDVFGVDEPAQGSTAAEGGAATPSAPAANSAEQRAGDEPTERHTAAQQPTEQHKPAGTMRFQDAASTRPRPPSLAEQRARIAAEEEQAAQLAEVERKSATRRKVMIGGGVTVGVVALVGAWYLLASPQSVTARCTVDGGTQADTVVTDSYCDPNYVTSHGGYVQNGLIFMPLPGGGYQQYHYYYGGSGGIGQRASGGSYSAPENANVKTGSGQTIQRGGFGITGKSGGGGGGEEGGGGRSGGS
jgi:hypothetical protein